MGYTNAWDEASPANTEDIKLGASRIRAVKTDIAERTGFEALTITTNLSLGSRYGFYYIVCSTLDLSITLPTAVGIAGKEITFVKTDATAYIATILPAGTETIKGGASWPLSFQYQHVTLKSDGTNWHVVAKSVTAADRFFNEKMFSIASASTLTDFWTSNGNYAHVTGVTPITSFGTANTAGSRRVVIFDGILTLTYSANLLTQTGADIVTAAGDVCMVIAESTSVARVVGYWRANGDSLSGLVQIDSTIETGTIQGSTHIPIDDTIPQITEGVECLSCVFTPKYKNSKLKISINLNVCAGEAGHVVAALFKDSDTNAIAVGVAHSDSNCLVNIGFIYTTTLALDTIAAITYSVRMGMNSSPVRLNGVGGRYFGGAACSSIVIDEIQG